MSGLYETVRVEDGRVRLRERHLERLRRSDVPEAVVRAADALIGRFCALAGAEPVVLRIDVDGCSPAPRPRAPSPATPVDLRSALAFDPADRSRERKRADRRWAEAAEAAAGGREALCISADGLVGETTRANVFAILADGAVVTPPVQGILPGVTRGWALARTGAVERPLPLAELRGARAAFLTTAGRGIVRVASVDGTALGDHPLVAELAEAWRRL